MNNSFNESILISKVNNMVKLIYNSITLNKLEDVIQFMSGDLYNKFKKTIDDNTSNNCRVIYDEVNVNSEIKNITNMDEYIFIDVRCNVKFLRYYVSLSDGSYISGDRDNRIDRILNITLKRKSNVENINTFNCLGCGSSINITNGYKCPNCGRVFDLDEYDFIIDKMG